MSDEAEFVILLMADLKWLSKVWRAGLSADGEQRNRCYYYYFFFDPGTQFPRKEKITLCNIKKYYYYYFNFYSR